ncbi:MAG: 2-phospho-L-lactate guanylyltransferase [Steroidobacteraceae bacterium]
MNVHALIPLKDPAGGKTRLARRLTAPQRIELIRAMLEHVVGALRATPEITDISVLTGDRSLVPHGCEAIPDGGLALNPAMTLAQGVLRRTKTGGWLVIVHADLPFLKPAEVRALVLACREDALVAAPDAAEKGTNALAFALARPIATRFGPDSLSAHSEAAAAAGLELVRIRRPGLAADIDEPEQLESLAQRGDSRYAFLRGGAVK